MATAAVEVPPAERALLERTARSLTTAGATLSGSQRRALAFASRSAAADRHRPGGPTEPSANDPLAEITHRLTVAPAAIRESWIQERERSGVDAPCYVEIIGLVARLAAVDTFTFAVGAEPIELPPATDDVPSGRIDKSAGLHGGWVPTVGPASPPNALSLIPDEHQAMHDVHDVLYMSVADMIDLDNDRGLHRTQMELVAARTSLLNECFF